MFNASTARRYPQPLGYRKFRASRAGRGGPSPCHQIAKTRLRGITMRPERSRFQGGFFDRNSWAVRSRHRHCRGQAE
jgi:hypothetical protein